jgi:hypothetical protein
MDFLLVRLSLTDMSNCCQSNRPGANQGEETFSQLEKIKLVHKTLIDTLSILSTKEVLSQV